MTEMTETEKDAIIEEILQRLWEMRQSQEQIHLLQQKLQDNGDEKAKSQS